MLLSNYSNFLNTSRKLEELWPHTKILINQNYYNFTHICKCNCNFMVKHFNLHLSSNHCIELADEEKSDKLKLMGWPNVVCLSVVSDWVGVQLSKTSIIYHPSFLSVFGYTLVPFWLSHGSITSKSSLQPMNFQSVNRYQSNKTVLCMERGASGYNEPSRQPQNQPAASRLPISPCLCAASSQSDEVRCACHTKLKPLPNKG